jgi:hypothetical protein
MQHHPLTDCYDARHHPSQHAVTPQDFIAQWGPGGPASGLNEEQGAQSHFLDLCELLGVAKPGSEPGYLFEQGSRLAGQASGYADVYKRGAFAWENKAPGKNLDAALRQLQAYSLALDNPPLLVVCDRLIIRIHTQFNGHPSERHEITLADLALHDKRELLRRVWTAPESFRPRTTNRDITEAAAKSFATLAERLRSRGNSPDDVAHFLTQCLFCCFAEDVGLLPGKLFDRLINARTMAPERLAENLGKLFEAMKSGGLFGVDDVPWFNGGLFQTIAVPRLDILDVTELRNAAEKNWSAIDVSIFGTLFERGLDPAKRSQLGAHYTDPATIERIIDPVIRRPLLREWAVAKQQIVEFLAKSKKRRQVGYRKMGGGGAVKGSAGDASFQSAEGSYLSFLRRLEQFRVLDPACGSGNFLYLALKCLKDVEHLVNTEAEALGLERQVELATGPANVLGIELNEYAAELARVTVWIGELQWRLDHGYPFKTNPVLEPLDHIECRDALLVFSNAVATEAPWPRADAVVGNPPFLGVSRKRGELGEGITRALDTVYAPGVPGAADLVCYWFAKALKAIETNGLQAVGLVATNSIRGGANRKVLDAITERSRIFEAWSDEPWVNDGAAVRVSLVCFGAAGDGAQLNGEPVPQIYADLTAPATLGDSLNLSKARSLATNESASFQGASKKAKFEIDAAIARDWLRLPNPNGRPNSDVLKPWANGFELSRGPQHQWIIDFGIEISEGDAALYEQPFGYVTENIKPERLKNNRESYRKYWWRFAEARPGLRAALKPLARFIATVAHSKHRFFVWLPVTTSPDQALITVTRADDTTFGILHSRFHELWALRMGTSLEDRPRYTPTTCFETFPFPEGLTPADTAHQQTEPVPGSPHGARAGAARRPGAQGGSHPHRRSRSPPERPARSLAQPDRVDRACARGDSAGHGPQPLPRPHRAQSGPECSRCQGAESAHAHQPVQRPPRLARPGPHRAGRRRGRRLQLGRRDPADPRRRHPRPPAGAEPGAGCFDRRLGCAMTGPFSVF